MPVDDQHFTPCSADSSRPTDDTREPGASDTSYDSRVASEQRHFSEYRPADELPEIYQYWSNTFLRPRLQRAGFDGPLDMFRTHLADSYDKSPAEVRRFLSIGSGDCQSEIALAEHLMQTGRADFVFECFELNPLLVERGSAVVLERGLSELISIQQVDANSWGPSREYDGVVANSSLHHIQNLEGVFDGIASSLLPTGTFLTSDTVGRNGHMRWPEALDIVEEYWRELPEEYRFNCQLRRQEREFVNWDCSGEGFEGIRAQDILPLLIQRFDFDFFAAFANVVDPFIDRTFGHNFDASREWDRRFVNRIEARDRAEIRCGRIKPTHIVAAMCAGRPGKCIVMDGLTPQFCVRDPSRAPRPLTPLGAVEIVTDDALAGYNADGSSASSVVAQDGELEIDVVPADPQCSDHLVARVRLANPQDSAIPRQPQALEIRIKSEGIVRFPDPGEMVEVSLGSFAEGKVDICAYVGNRSTSRTVAVSPRVVRQGAVPIVNYSDLWWNPSEPGWGVSVHQHPNGQLVAFWLGYGHDGEPTWLSLHPGGWVTEFIFEGPVYRHRGSAYDAYDPGKLVGTVAGKGSLAFRTSTTGTLTCELTSGRLAKEIERMDF